MVDRVVIVTKPTRFEDLVREYFTESAAQFNLESRGQSLTSYKEEDAAYKAALAEIRRQLPNDMPSTEVHRDELPHFQFRDKDLIVVCGPDGLFVNTAKYVGAQQVLGVNPDPKTIAGVLMLFKPNEVGSVIKQAVARKVHIEKLPFVKATIDENRVVWGINDIFIGRKDHVSARYELSLNNRSEHQSSSGIIVSTGVGGSGWLKSVMTMVAGLTQGGQSRLSSLPDATSEQLVFVVREPFPSPNTGASLITGRVVPGKPLTVVSAMPKGGCIFSDGVVEKALEWNAGSTVVVSVGDRFVQRIVR